MREACRRGMGEGVIQAFLHTASSSAQKRGVDVVMLHAILYVGLGEDSGTGQERGK